MKQGSQPDPREALYKSTIMTHYRSMEHRKLILNPSLESQQVNRSCGDKVKLQFVVDSEHLIIDASYQGEGCSMCIASASILCGTVKGRALPQAQSISNEVIDMLELSDKDEAVLARDNLATTLGEQADVLSLWSIREFGARVPCALLSWKILPGLLEKTDS